MTLNKATPSIRQATFKLVSTADSVVRIVAADGAEELLGIGEQDFKSGHILLQQLIHQEDSDLFGHIVDGKLPGGERSCNLRLRQANGKILCVKAQYKRERCADGVTVDLLLQDVRSLPRTIEQLANTPNFVAVLESTDDYIYFKDRNHVFTGVSQSLVSMYKTHEHWTHFIGLTDYDVFPESLADTYYQNDKQVFAGVAGDHEVQEIVRGDGTKAWVDNYKHPIKDEHGDIIGLYGIARDITRQVVLERDQRWTTELLQRTGALAQVGGWAVDLATMKQSWTLETFRISDIDSLVEPSVEEGINFYGPKSRPLIAQAVQKLIETGEPYDLNLEYITVKGNKKWVRAQGEAEIVNGKVVRIFGAFQDLTTQRETQEKLRQNEERWRFAIEGSGDGVCDWDIPKREVLYSKRWKNMLGFSDDDIGVSEDEWLARVHPDDISGVKAELQAHIDGHTPFAVSEFRIRCKDSAWKWILGRGLVVARGNDGAALRMLSTHSDITGRKQTELDLLKSKNALDEAQRLAHMGSWEMDAASYNMTWSEELYRITRMDPGLQTISFPQLERLYSPQSWTQLTQAVERCLLNGETYEIELEMIRADGSNGWLWVRGEIIRDAKGETTGLRGVAMDITQRKQAEETANKLASFDPLTGLANRDHLIRLLTTAVRECQSLGILGGMILIDINSLKTLNDSLGHEAGDALLLAVSVRLQQNLPRGSILARFGGDEFVLLFGNLGRTAKDASLALNATAQELLAKLEDNYPLAKGSFYCTCSAGMTIFGGTDSSPMELLQQIDVALDYAKQSGRNTARFFDRSWQNVISERAQLITDLRYAIKNKEFEMYYQPQVDKAGSITGAEALIRWNHPVRGFISPADFIPVAELHGLMLILGNLILQMCFKQLRQWQDSTELRHMKMSINITADHFYSDGFADMLVDLIADYQLDVRGIMLEFTESMLLNNIEKAHATISQLKAHGVRFAIDDFGTGYSSLAYLSEMSIDQLKIDQSFVRNIGKKDKDRAIIRTIIDMAKILDMQVLAEGVETVDERELLLQYGCEYFQGYLFSQPVPAQDFEALIRGRSSLADSVSD